MNATNAELRAWQLDGMSREDLLAALRQLGEPLQLRFTAEWLQRKSTDQLRILLLTARLLAVLRQQRNRAPAAECAEPLSIRPVTLRR
jgi:hypothetical protein